MGGNKFRIKKKYFPNLVKTGILTIKLILALKTIKYITNSITKSLTSITELIISWLK